MMEPKLRLGFVGQGWIGRNLADHFADRGFEVVRYSLEAEHEKNRNDIAECDIVFIAVPTPTSKTGFILDNVRSALNLVGKGKIAVIKSTILPGSTDQLSKEFSDIFVFHSPEFLREVTVRQDIDEPERNVVGIPHKFLENTDWRKRAETVMDVLPMATRYITENVICSATEAELVKYIGNNFLATKVVFMNLMYDLAVSLGADWQVIANTVSKDTRIGPSHMQPVHQHGHMGEKTGRGAGGHCFPKDLAALRFLYEKTLPTDKSGLAVLKAIENKNKELLVNSHKDLDILSGIYG